MKVFGNEWKSLETRSRGAHDSSDFYSDKRMGKGEGKNILFSTEVLYMTLCFYEPKYN